MGGKCLRYKGLGMSGILDIPVVGYYGYPLCRGY